MIIKTINRRFFELAYEDKEPFASLKYTDDTYSDAVVETTEKYLLNNIAVGLWILHAAAENSSKVKAKLRVETGGVISIKLQQQKRKYFFKKSAGWKLRFSLVNKDGEDILSLLPATNWQQQAHNYVLQLNDEYEKECDSFLILQAVHCANVSLSMMTGGPVPALVNI